jgi:hypothetical protein
VDAKIIIETFYGNSQNACLIQFIALAIDFNSVNTSKQRRENLCWGGGGWMLCWILLHLTNPRFLIGSSWWMHSENWNITSSSVQLIDISRFSQLYVTNPSVVSNTYGFSNYNIQILLLHWYRCTAVQFALLVVLEELFTVIGFVVYNCKKYV